MKSILLFILIAFAGCESQTTPSSNIVPGDIEGRVLLLDTLYRTLQVERSGVSIRIEGTTFTAITDSSGYWQMKDVPAGTYVLTFEKSGFGTKKAYNLQHTGNGTLYLGTATMMLLPRVSVNIVQRDFEDFDTIPKGKADYTVTISSGILKYATYYGLKAFLFVAKNRSIDPTISNTYDTAFTTGPSIVDTTGYQISLQKKTMLSLGYKSGDTIYVMAAVNLLENYNDYGYYDYSQRRFIYTGWGQNYSPVKSFLLP